MPVAPLYEQLNNYVKLRTTKLTINGVSQTVHNYERIHQTKFDCVQKGDDVIAFMDGGRTVLVINGDAEASDYDSKTVLQIMTAANTFIAALEETRS